MRERERKRKAFQRLTESFSHYLNLASFHSLCFFSIFSSKIVLVKFKIYTTGIIQEIRFFIHAVTTATKG